MLLGFRVANVCRSPWSRPNRQKVPLGGQRGHWNRQKVPLGGADEAIAVISDAVQRVEAVRGSGRIVSDLRHTVDLLGQQNYSLARTFAAAARRLLPASA